MVRPFVFPGYRSADDEQKIRMLIYKGLKEIERQIGRRMLNGDSADELGRALKAVNMLALRVRTPQGRPTNVKDLEQVDAAIFDKMNLAMSQLASKEYAGLLSTVSDLEKLVARRNSLIS